MANTPRATIVRGLLICMFAQTGTLIAQDSPKQVMELYCNLDTSGAGLTPDGWAKMSRLVTNPGPRHWERLYVTKSYSVYDAEIKGDRATDGVLYFYLGEIHHNATLTDIPNPTSPEDPIRGRTVDFYTLVRTGQPEKARRGGKEGNEVPITSGWKIEGTLSNPTISVKTAIDYLTRLRDQTRSPAIRKNATKSIAALKRMSRE